MTLAEVYGIPEDEDVTDVVWLERCGDEDWVVLMKDERIRYRAAERQALIDHGVRAFCLTGGNLRAADMADIFIASMPAMLEVARVPGPFLYAVSRSGLRLIAM